MKIFNKISARLWLVGFLCISVAGTAFSDTTLGNGLFARISTVRGDIIVRLEFQQTPLTVCNFVALAEGTMNATNGRRFYDGLTFHRVIQGFMIQGGDPLGNGRGGPGYQFPDEIVRTLRHDGPGVLSMANAGPGTNGSQFFITHSAQPHLDGRHTVFGRVVQGQDVVNNIRQGDRINQVTIIRNGPEANAFRADQAAFETLFRAATSRSEARRNNDLASIQSKYPNATVTDSGIRYIIQRAGTGDKPSSGKTVLVNYRGMFVSGETFDNSDIHGGPLEFQIGLGKVIPGWEESIMDMQQGERRLVVIPPELAYGERGYSVIPENSYLVFEMELVRIR